MRQPEDAAQRGGGEDATSIAARTRQAISAEITSSPKRASSVLGSRGFPSATVVCGLGTTMPAATEACSSTGTAATIRCCTPASVSVLQFVPSAWKWK